MSTCMCIMALFHVENKARKPTRGFLCDRQTHLFVPGCWTCCHSRLSWGSEEAPHGSADGAETLSFAGKPSRLLGRNTNAHSRWREQRGEPKVALQRENLVHVVG